MRARPLVALTALIVSLATLPAATVAAEEEALLPLLDSGTVTLELAGRQLPIGYLRTVAGPLFALPPLVSQLGGELELGPLGQGHTLRLDGADFLLGPGSPALTHGEEIVPLSQAPQPAAGGLHVPLDLLRRTWGASYGVEFEWRPAERTLVAVRRPPREIEVSIDLVHLQGVSTVVLQFSDRPRYQIRRGGSAVVLEVVGDRLQFGRRSTPQPGGLVRGVRPGPQGVRIDLSPDAQAEEYTLERPFRVVFDVYRGRGTSLSQLPPPEPPRRRSAGVRTIVIDPGHGGSDTGAAGPAGSLEKDLTLQLARTLKAGLERRLPVRVVLTRGEDAELPLDTRAALANQQKADLFISLHLNSAPERRAAGAETYFLSLVASDERAARAAAAENAGDPLSDLQLILWDLAQSHHMAESQRLASIIQEELNRALELRNRGVKQAPFRVLMGVAMPAVLVELGFLSNPREEERLLDPLYRSRLADALVDAVIRYRALTEDRPAPAEESLR